MPRLSRTQTVARERLIELGNLGLASESLGQRALEILTTVIPNDGMRLWTVDSDSLFLNRLIASTRDDHFQREIWLRNYYLSDTTARIPYFSSHQVLTSGLGAVAIQPEQRDTLGLTAGNRDETTEAFHRTLFHETESPVAGWSFTGLPVRRRWVGLLVTMHRERGSELDGSRFGFLRLVAPLIGRMLDAALRREIALRPAVGVEAPLANGIVMVSADRRISFATPAGERWLDLLSDTDRANGSRNQLPTSLYSAYGLLASTKAAGTDAAVATLVVPTRHGPVRLEASSADYDGTTALVIGPANPAQLPLIPHHWPLTEQERRVARMIVAGSSNRAIAETLCISGPTVESHIVHIFTKLGINNRTMLAGLLFQAVNLPAIPN